MLSPFIVANSGPPFNIITGQDLNLDRQVNERPSFAPPNADCSLSTIRCTRFGNFNLVPLTGERIVPRNFGESPGSVVVNLRISRVFAFGTVGGSNAAARPQPGPAPPVPAGGGPQRVGPGGPGGPGPQGGPPPSEKRYNLNVSLYFQNVLNHVNLGTPVGNLSSPSFGESLGLGGIGGFGGGGGSTGAGNRRIYAQVRLNF